MSMCTDAVMVLAVLQEAGVSEASSSSEAAEEDAESAEEDSEDEPCMTPCCPLNAFVHVQLQIRS